MADTREFEVLTGAHDYLREVLLTRGGHAVPVARLRDR